MTFLPYNCPCGCPVVGGGPPCGYCGYPHCKLSPGARPAHCKGQPGKGKPRPRNVSHIAGLPPESGSLRDVVQRVQDIVQWTRSADTKAIHQELVNLKSTEGIWQAIPSGNRKYFERALNHPDDAHLDGARNHLMYALPQRIGYIYLETAAEAKDQRAKIAACYAGIKDRQEQMEALSDAETWRLAEDALIDPDVQRLVFQGRNQAASEKSLKLMVDKYRRLSEPEAQAYAAQKRQSVSNILRKVVIPQLAAGAAEEAAVEGG